MDKSVFLEFDFFALILFSGVLPTGLYAYMMWQRAISRRTVFFLGVCLIALAGIDLFLLLRLTGMAKRSLSLIDDQFFLSEFSVALYLLPALFAGLGVNVLSHILMSHLTDAEHRFDREHR